MAKMTGEHTTRPSRDTRAEAVRIALKVFAEHGYEGTSLQQIADRLGVTKAALYYYFRSKDDLLQAVLAPYLADVNALLAGSLAYPTLAPKRENARAGIEDYLDFLLTHRELTSYLARDAAAYALPIVSDLLTEFWAAIQAVIAGVELRTASRVKVSIALGGMQQAISLHADVPAEQLRAPILQSVELALGSIDIPGAAVFAPRS